MRTKTIHQSKLNPSGEPGIPVEWAAEIMQMARDPNFHLDTRYGLLYLGTHTDPEDNTIDLWQILRVDTLPYAADTCEYTLRILQAGQHMDLPRLDPANPLLETE